MNPLQPPPRGQRRRKARQRPARDAAPFLAKADPRRARHWWIRVGTKDSDTSLSVVGNLAAKPENLGDDVNASMYWDGGHGANEDAADFIQWIADVTGHKG